MSTSVRPDTTPATQTSSDAKGDDNAQAPIETIRATAEDLGERAPEVIDNVRAGALEGARTIGAWPEPTRRVVAAFSVGLGAGLAIAGAPRLFVASALVPAIVVAVTAMREDAERTSPA
jgi:hypothetical protein